MPWMQRRSAAEYYGVGVRTLDKWRQRGMPFVRSPTGTILINADDGDDWLRSSVPDAHRLLDELMEGL